MKNDKDICLISGDTYSCKLTFTYDITGLQFRFAAKRDKDDVTEDLALLYTTTVGDNPLDVAADGIVFIDIPSTTTSELNVGEYDYSLSMTDSSIPPVTKTLIVGKLDVEAKV